MAFLPILSNRLPFTGFQTWFAEPVRGKKHIEWQSGGSCELCMCDFNKSSPALLPNLDCFGNGNQLGRQERNLHRCPFSITWALLMCVLDHVCIIAVDLGCVHGCPFESNVPSTCKDGRQEHKLHRRPFSITWALFMSALDYGCNCSGLGMCAWVPISIKWNKHLQGCQ